MRQRLLASVGVSLGLAVAPAVVGQEPIASNARPGTPAASLGVPVALGTQQPVTAVSYSARAQKDDKPSGPLLQSDAGSFAPLHQPAIASSGPLAPPVPVSPSVPCTNCLSGPFDPAAAPLPGGFFAAPSGGAWPNNRWWVSGEYLYWWIRDGGMPVLVTSGPVNAANPIPGVLNPVLGPDTQVLYGNDSLDTQGRSGVRFEAGRWFGSCRPWAIEAGAFFLGQRTANFNASGDGSAGSPAIARPFFESNRGVENVEYVSLPGVAGDITISSTNNFYGAHIDWRRRLWCGACWRIDGQLGFRYVNFDEDLTISERSTVIGPPAASPAFPLGTTSTTNELFRVDNDFYGGLIGFVGEVRRGSWSLQLTTRVALGTTREQIEIAGSQVINIPGQPTINSPGGLLARPSNIGTYESDTFSVIPEVGFNVGLQVTQRLRVFAGYSFLYWSNMVRAGDQIDRTVNVAGVPFFPQPPAIPAGDPNRPAPILKETDFWAQGVNVGLLFTW